MTSTKIFLIISNVVRLIRDKSILFSRIVIKALLFTTFIAINNLYVNLLERGVRTHKALFNVNVLTQTFQLINYMTFTYDLIKTCAIGHYLKRAYNSLEWGLTSSPKPHAFASLPLQSGLWPRDFLGAVKIKLQSKSF